MKMRFTAQLLSVLFLMTACGEQKIIDLTGGQQLFEVRYDQVTGKLKVAVHPSLHVGQSLHVRVRQGGVGMLNCNQMAPQIPRIDNLNASTIGGSPAFWGPQVDASIFEPVYDNSWLSHEPPTMEMIQNLQGKFYTIDLCLMDDNGVVRGAEMDIQRALDVKGTGKFDGYDSNERIASVTAYGQACIHPDQLGEIPFFEKIADGDYRTYNCLDSVPIPTTVTDENGAATWPQQQVAQCDNPQYIYSLCEPNAVTGQTNGPRVASRMNDQGTHWVLLCRKSRTNEGEYNDIAMVGHNPYTGKTCFFQNALYARTDGVRIPHPADEVNSELSPQTSESLWSGLQGGYGSGIECVRCHSSDPLVHTPWIDGAKDERGDPVIPKMGITDGFNLGFNDAPYSLVNMEAQGWTMPKHLVSEEIAACTKCHRIGDARWSNSWNSRLVGEDVSWNNKVTPAYSTFEHVYWMPPDMESLDEASWPESEFGKAMAFLRNCAANPTNTLCKWEELPTEAIVDVGELPTIELEGEDLAREALKVIGANVFDANDPNCSGEGNSCKTMRCSECHAVGKAGIKHWSSLTKKAKTFCRLNKDPETMTQEDALAAVNCVRARPEDPNSVFAADKVGIMVTGARYGYFRSLFRKAYGEQNWLKPYVTFKARVSMPKGAYAALSQREFAVLSKWFESNLANMNDVIKDPPAPTSCENYFDTEALQLHIDEMKFDGWGAVNKEAGIWSYGCPVNAEASECFGQDYPDRTADWGNGNGTLKEVVALTFRTSFWTRSSADGRFVGNGGGTESGATITDLVRGIDIHIKASYDPGFFPDNSGFIFQGGGTNICSQSILETETDIDFKEVGCMKGNNINLYQHVARGLNGGDYLIINSQFTSDSGGGSKNPRAMFNAGSTMKFTPMIFNGTTYEQLKQVVIDSPFEGDSVLSPSGRLVISRQSGAPDSQPLGYVIRELVAEKFGNNYKITIDKVVAKICFPGAKANISYDERFFVTHAYNADGAPNIFLVDLTTGQNYQITNMQPGVRALFPHFRSDGWLYFLVREDNKEYVVASDLAVKLAAGL
jgi:hypothetical protein